MSSCGAVSGPASICSVVRREKIAGINVIGLARQSELDSNHSEGRQAHKTWALLQLIVVDEQHQLMAAVKDFYMKMTQLCIDCIQ